MNFLEMAQFVQAQIGTSADLPWAGPSTTVNQTGQYLEILNWIDMAYKSIQVEQPDWLWRWKKGTLALTVGKNTYSFNDIQAQIDDFEEMKDLHFINDVRYLLCYDTKVGVSSQTFVYFYSYQNYRGWRDRSVIPTGKPAYYTVDPSGSGTVLELSPIPDNGTGMGYTLTLDYRTALDTLIGQGDGYTPLYMPAQYHEAICWRAIMYWAQQRESAVKYAGAKTEFDRIMLRMRSSELPETEFYLGEYF